MVMDFDRALKSYKEFKAAGISDDEAVKWLRKIFRVNDDMIRKIRAASDTGTSLPAPQKAIQRVPRAPASFIAAPTTAYELEEAESVVVIMPPLTSPQQRRSLAKQVFPEAREVLDIMSLTDIPGNKPRKPLKFYEKIKVLPTPAKFSPSSISDSAFTKMFSYENRYLAEGPSYTYDTLPNMTADPFERFVNVPRGSRVWVCTYDGMWGGYWARVDVYVSPEDFSQNTGYQKLA
jgi:hypothetical protein